MEEHGIAVYAMLDGQNRILDISSGMFLRDVSGWTKMDEGTGDKYSHAYNHYLPGRPLDADGIPLYQWDGSAVLPRTQEEIEADRAAIVAQEPVPTETERLRADVDYIAAMTGIEL